MAGYGRYAKTLTNLKLGRTYHRLMPKPAREFVAARIENLALESKVRHKLRKSFFTLAPEIDEIYFDNFAVFPRRMQAEMLTGETRARIGGAAAHTGRACVGDRPSAVRRGARWAGSGAYEEQHRDSRGVPRADVRVEGRRRVERLRAETATLGGGGKCLHASARMRARPRTHT